MATKLRALYQRRKGRDLFDLWHVLTALEPNDEKIVHGLRHYMKEQAFSYPELVSNLVEKLTHPEFIGDLDQLVVAPPPSYVLEHAADLVLERLGSKLANAPEPGEIANGAWRM